MIIGFLAATVMLDTFWTRYISNPSQIYVESNHAPINDLQFPAVTFCHENQISNQRAESMIKTL